MRGAGENLFLVFLSHTAQNTQYLAGVVLHVQPEAPQGAVNLVFRMLAHAAGVEKDHIRLTRLVHQRIAMLAQGADHQLAVQHIHLAANGLDIQFAAHDCGAIP